MSLLKSLFIEKYNNSIMIILVTCGNKISIQLDEFNSAGIIAINTDGRWILILQLS